MFDKTISRNSSRNILDSRLAQGMLVIRLLVIGNHFTITVTFSITTWTSLFLCCFTKNFAISHRCNYRIRLQPASRRCQTSGAMLGATGKDPPNRAACVSVRGPHTKQRLTRINTERNPARRTMFVNVCTEFFCEFWSVLQFGRGELAAET